MDIEELKALEYIGFDTERALPYAGPMAPVIIYTLAPEDVLTDNKDGTYTYRAYDYDNECLGDETITIRRLEMGPGTAPDT